MRRHQLLQRGLGIAAETVAWQSKDLFTELTDIFATMRTNKAYSEAEIAASGVRETIQRHTGMSVTLSVFKNTFFDNRGENAWVFIPELDRNHFFFQEYVREFVDTKGIDLVQAFGEALVGGVDLKNAKVTGYFSRYEINSVVTTGLLDSKKITPAEVAAIVLHELGHAFTYFEHLGTTVMTAVISGAAAKASLEIEEAEQRVKVLDVAAKRLGIKLDNAEELANLPKAQRAPVIQSVLLSSAIEHTRVENAAETYSFRACEQIADQFAVRHGAGRDLVTGLAKMMRGLPEANGIPIFLVRQLFSVIMFLAMTIGLYGLPLILIWFMNPLDTLYDEPHNRLEMMRRQMLDQLKDKNLPPEIAKQLHADLELVATIADKFTDRRGLWGMIYTTIVPRGRHDWDQLRVQKEIETLTNNDLYLQASKFKHGASE